MLTLTSLQKSFRGLPKPVLNGINLTFYPGEFCVVIGSNGSGKSTLMKSISGEYSIDSGKIEINQEELTLKNRSHLIASVTQDVNKGTIPELTLLENMALSLERGKTAKLKFYQSKRSFILNLLKSMDRGLEQFIDTPLQYLSGGQRQMIAVLMAICSKPQILLLDEHTSALDPKTQRLLMQFTAEYVQSQAITTMMITHKLEDAIHFGNRLIMLHQGQIVLDLKGALKKALKLNDLHELFQQERHNYV